MRGGITAAGGSRDALLQAAPQKGGVGSLPQGCAATGGPTEGWSGVIERGVGSLLQVREGWGHCYRWGRGAVTGRVGVTATGGGGVESLLQVGERWGHCYRWGRGGVTVTGGLTGEGRLLQVAPHGERGGVTAREGWGHGAMSEIREQQCFRNFV
jgi:hypothetical protein